MAERQQDLVRRPVEPTHEPVLGSEYFSRLSLGDIYGRTTLKPGTQITTDIPYEENMKWHNAIVNRDPVLQEIADKYGIPHASSFSPEWVSGRNAEGKFGNLVENPRLVISVGMGAPMTNWAPFIAERGAVAALATSIAGKDKPVVLEVGAGNGFTSKLLAADNRLRLVATDPIVTRYKQLPDTPGDISFRDTDAIDLVEEFGPTRSSQDTARIKEILKKIKDSFMQDKNMYYWGMQHGVFRDMGYGDFSKDVAELRKAAGRYREQSPVDLVVCSFMTTGDDLTLAIKDGIRPKAIVYVMPLNGLSGVGNYYFEEGRQGVENKVVSFNPGKEYHTVARWQTFWQDEWSRFCYNSSFGIEQADVVVQLRNDVKPRQPHEIPVVQTYPFDAQLADAIQTGPKPTSEHFHANFYRGIMEKMELLKPRIDLPYRIMR